MPHIRTILETKSKSLYSPIHLTAHEFEAHGVATPMIQKDPVVVTHDMSSFSSISTNSRTFADLLYQYTKKLWRIDMQRAVYNVHILLEERLT